MRLGQPVLHGGLRQAPGQTIYLYAHHTASTQSRPTLPAAAATAGPPTQPIWRHHYYAAGTPRWSPPWLPARLYLHAPHGHNANTHTASERQASRVFLGLFLRFHRRSRLALHCGDVAVSHPNKLKASTFSGVNTIRFAWTINPDLLNDRSLAAEEACDQKERTLKCIHWEPRQRHGTSTPLPAMLPLPIGCKCHIAVPLGIPLARRRNTYTRRVMEAKTGREGTCNVGCTRTSGHRPSTHLCGKYSPCQGRDLGVPLPVGFPPLQCIPFFLLFATRTPSFNEPPVDFHLERVGVRRGGGFPPGMAPLPRA